MEAVEKTIALMVASGEYNETGARAAIQRKLMENKDSGMTWDEALNAVIEYMEISLAPQPITAKREQGNWVTGLIHGIKYTAKVFEEGSQYGINGGNISQLWIGDRIEYDRGWLKRPKTAEDKQLLKEIEEFFKGWKVV